MVNRTKSINHQIELMHHSFVVQVGTIAQPDGEVRVSVEIHPGGDEPIIPPELYLVCTDENDSVLGTVVAGDNDALIQLPPFTYSVGTKFGIGLQMGCLIAEEHFVV